MMKAILAVIYMLFSSMAFAQNAYCDSRPSYSEQRRCYANSVPQPGNMYENQLNRAKIQMVSQLNIIYAYHKVSREEKYMLNKDQFKFEKETNRNCGRDYRCFIKAAERRTFDLGNLMRGYMKR